VIKGNSQIITTALHVLGCGILVTKRDFSNSMNKFCEKKRNISDVKKKKYNNNNNNNSSKRG